MNARILMTILPLMAVFLQPANAADETLKESVSRNLTPLTPEILLQIVHYGRNNTNDTELESIVKECGVIGVFETTTVVDLSRKHPEFSKEIIDKAQKLHQKWCTLARTTIPGRRESGGCIELQGPTPTKAARTIVPRQKTEPEGALSAAQPGEDRGPDATQEGNTKRTKGENGRRETGNPDTQGKTEKTGEKTKNGGEALKKEDKGFSGPSIMFGYVTLNPYRVNRTTAGDWEVQTSDKTTSFMIQANWAWRWAWEDSHTSDTSYQGFGLSTNKVNCLALLDPRGWDIQARAAYTFLDDATNASTVIGSGDLTLEASVGKHIYRQAVDDRFLNLNLEAAVSSVTDRDFLDIHTTVLFGPAVVASVPIGKTNDVRFFFLLRGGPAWYEVPMLKNTDSLLVDTEHGVPDFKSVWGAGMEMEMGVRLWDGFFISSGGRLYGPSEPNPWSAWVGASLSWDLIRNALPPK